MLRIKYNSGVGQETKKKGTFSSEDPVMQVIEWIDL